METLMKEAKKAPFGATKCSVAKLAFPIIGLFSLIWFLVRVVPKPSRATYPCQQAAFPMASAFIIWIFGLGTTALLLGRSKRVQALEGGRRIAAALTAVGIIGFAVPLQTCADAEDGVGPMEIGDTRGESDAKAVTDTDMGADSPIVSIVQSETSAPSITLEQIRSMVAEAVSRAGGLDFISDGQSVVLKPNLVSITIRGVENSTPLPTEANGVTTDWRIAFAVAELVRARNPTGQILVIEGSIHDTEDAFEQFGYTSTNFGDTVDEFIALEGSSCTNPDTSHLVQTTAPSGRTYWMDERYLNADVVISLPVLKTHATASITGALKNIGIGMTPHAMYRGFGGCTRSFVAPDHTNAQTISPWIVDVFALNPADFTVMDGLRGLANGPLPAWSGGDYYSDVKNMRLIMASKDSVAMDTVQALVMDCDPARVPVLQLAKDSGLGENNIDNIYIAGKQITEVRETLSGCLR
jgi:uncharacterized protein (DUF362 family)